MKHSVMIPIIKNSFLFILLLLSVTLSAQMTSQPVSKSDFWQRVQFGGIIGASVGSGYTDITVAPSGIYNFNPYFAAGVGIQGTYVRVKNSFEAYIYGGSIIGLFNPIEQLQVSAELEQVRVSRNFSGPLNADNFWNTALFIGAGYRVENVTIGARYNVLYSEDDFVYGDAFMPFVRVYF